MLFSAKALSMSMANPHHEPQAAAEQANLCMEKRVSTARQAEYEARVDSATDWDDWRGHHSRYIREDVRRRYPLSAAFAPGEPSLRPGVEPNQYLLRVERIDAVLKKYSDDTGKPVDVAEVNRWIAASRGEDKAAPRNVGSLADLGRLMSGTPATPETSVLEDLTDLFNEERKGGRPSFVMFDAEFPDLEHRPDWAQHICERCGLAHLFVGSPVTLALFTLPRSGCDRYAAGGA